MGCGKTLAGAVEALKTMLLFPGSRGLVGRFTDGELRRTSWREFLTIVPPELIAYENKADLQIKLLNGSEAFGMHLQEEMKIRSLNLDWFWIDEATEISERLFHQLMGRLRSSVGPRRGWFTTNPDSRSSWVYRTFIQSPKRGFAHFHGRTSDAVFLPSDYLESLYETYDDEWIQRFLEGSWDTLEGMVFPMFDRETHVLPWTKADIPREWTRVRGMDHGWADPAVCVFAAVSPDGGLYVYDLYYRRHRTVEQICEEVIAMSEGQRFDWTVMDPSTDRHESITGRRVSEEYRRCGLPVIMAKRQLINVGIARMRNLLQVRTSEKRHPTNHSYRTSKLYICAHCVPAIKELQDYRYPEDGGETPIDKHNHFCDACRYICLHDPRFHVEMKADQWKSWFDHLRSLRAPRQADHSQTIGNENALWN